MLNSSRCRKCGQYFKKEIKKCYLKGYTPDTELCAGCNAAQSVIKRLDNGGIIDKEELEILPSFLIFNPNGEYPEEEKYGSRFIEITNQVQ